MKTRSLSYWKKKLWKLVSEFVRRSFADRNGNCRCVTCGVLRNWKEMQAGHFIDGHMNAIMFDLRGIHPQCFACNCMKHGNKVEYYKFMLEEYGQEVIDELRAKAKTAVKITVSDYEINILDFTQRLKGLAI